MTNLLKKFKGGIDVPAPYKKDTAACETVKMDVPDKVVVSMLQHKGTPCSPVVKIGDRVKVGQIIGTSGDINIPPVHASVSGRVSNISSTIHANGNNIVSMEIESDGMAEVNESVKPPVFKGKTEFINLIRDSGLVGLGGAGVPTHLKLSSLLNRSADTLIINGSESDPHITSDYREIVEEPQNIVDGISILLEVFGFKNAIIGVETHKFQSIEPLINIASNKKNINIVKLNTCYPQGAEKLLIYSLTGKRVPFGKLPAEFGVLVLNISTVSFISKYIKSGMPLIKKRVTVAGSSVAKPANIEVVIGTQIKDIFAFCGGLKGSGYKVSMGGSLMGFPIDSLETQVLKYTNALVAMDTKDIQIPALSACIKCGKCNEACPMKLLPSVIDNKICKGNFDGLEKYHVVSCIECGCCSYVCPAKRYPHQSTISAKAHQMKKLKRG